MSFSPTLPCYPTFQAGWGSPFANLAPAEDNHVPPAGRDLIRQTLTDAGVTFSWYEVAWAQRMYLVSVYLDPTPLPLADSSPFGSLLLKSYHVSLDRWRLDFNIFFPLRTRLTQSILLSIDAFIRDELSKGRYDPAIAGICFDMLLELFNRTLRSDLGPRHGGEQKIENIC
jgi:hypothetical protein